MRVEVKISCFVERLGLGRCYMPSYNPEVRVEGPRQPGRTPVISYDTLEHPVPILIGLPLFADKARGEGDLVWSTLDYLAVYIVPTLALKGMWNVDSIEVSYGSIFP